MQKLGRITIERLELEKDGNQLSTYAYGKCDCGKDYKGRLKHLKSGKVISCGCHKSEMASKTCIAKNTTHNMAGSKLYSTWNGIKGRCLYPSSLHYRNYGGRGVKICDEWMIFDNFEKWANSNGYKSGLVLDRINVDGNYEPSNCRWVTIKENSNNKRNNVRYDAFGESKTIPQWIEDSRCLCKNATTLYYRFRKLGWGIEEALTTETFRRSNQKMAADYARCIDSNINGMWIRDKAKDGINDVHIYTQKAQDNSIVLGHNTKEMDKLNGTPLAVILGSEKEGIRLQYKTDAGSLDNVAIEPEVFAKHFLDFLIKVRNETCANPVVIKPKKPAELEE